MRLIDLYNQRVTTIFKITLDGGESPTTILSLIKAQRDRACLVGINLAIEDLINGSVG